MSRRDPLTLTLTAALGACSDPIIGDWELRALNSEPLTYSSNLSGPYGYGCGEYVREVEESLAGLLHVGAELDASLSLVYAFRYYLYIEGCAEAVDIEETYLYTYSGVATERDDGNYQIQLSADSGDTMPLTCALSDDTLDCEGEFDTYEFSGRVELSR
jgi:hypothetical protein